MARQEPEHPRLGLIERAYASVPLSPAAVGAAISSVLVLAFGASELALGRHLLGDIEAPGAPLSLARIAVVNCLTAGYLPTAYVYLLRGYRDTFSQLRGNLGCSDAEVNDVLRGIGRYGPVAVGFACLAGIGIVIWTTRATTPPQVDPWAWSAMPQEVRWHRGLGLWNGPWIGILLLVGIAEGRRLARLATRAFRVDLLDLRPLRPFTRQALLNAFLLAVLVGLGLLSFVESGFWEKVIGYWILGVVVIAIGLVYALLPIHQLVQVARRAQLDWCRDALIRERTKLQEGGAEHSRIREIVAYRDVVEGVSTWPADGATFVRFSLYLLIPLGSWAGGAIVERFIDGLLG